MYKYHNSLVEMLLFFGGAGPVVVEDLHCFFYLGVVVVLGKPFFRLSEAATREQINGGGGVWSE